MAVSVSGPEPCMFTFCIAPWTSLSSAAVNTRIQLNSARKSLRFQTAGPTTECAKIALLPDLPDKHGPGRPMKVPSINTVHKPVNGFLIQLLWKSAFNLLQECVNRTESVCYWKFDDSVDNQLLGNASAIGVPRCQKLPPLSALPQAVDYSMRPSYAKRLNHQQNGLTSRSKILPIRLGAKVSVAIGKCAKLVINTNRSFVSLLIGSTIGSVFAGPSHDICQTISGELRLHFCDGALHEAETRQN